ncbi:MAG: hypothetical protein H7138_22980, partial [Myxococcales bacterium]|nr:hypothetical protein [Myxococcales bacterium]
EHGEQRDRLIGAGVHRSVAGAFGADRGDDPGTDDAAGRLGVADEC